MTQASRKTRRCSRRSRSPRTLPP